jgi:hypothetical protein
LRRIVILLAGAALWSAVYGDEAAAGAVAPGHASAGQDRKGVPLWDFYDSTLSHAKYIDLTHAIAQGEPFSYEKHGVAITAYGLPMDHIGTQFGPPAHENGVARAWLI